MRRRGIETARSIPPRAVLNRQGVGLLAGYAAAKPAFCQTSARAALASASVGESVLAHVLKALMPEAKTTLCVSTVQPETVIFWLVSVAFAKAIAVPDRLRLTSDAGSPPETRSGSTPIPQRA